MSELHSVLDPPICPKPGKTNYWGQLYGASHSLAIASVVKKHPGFIIILTDTINDAIQLEEQIKFFINPETVIVDFPSWETLPYDKLSPHQDIISKRLQSLYSLPKINNGILITTTEAALFKLPPKQYINNNSLVFNQGQNYDFNELIKKLDSSGYIRVKQVMEHGEFSVKGEIIDLFPMGQKKPIRLDFFDNEIEAIKTFDINSQRSEQEIQKIKILPAKELPIDPKSIAIFNKKWYQHFASDHFESIIYKSINNDISPAGIEYYLPLFFEETASIFDYLPQKTIVITTTSFEDSIDRTFNNFKDRYANKTAVLKPQDILFSKDEIFHNIKQFSQIKYQNFKYPDKTGRINFHSNNPPTVAIDHTLKEPMSMLLDFIKKNPKILFVAESAGRKEALKDMFLNRKLHVKEVSGLYEFIESKSNLSICTGSLDTGLYLSNPSIAIITESQLFGTQIKQRRRNKSSKVDSDKVINNLIELKLNDPVVHIEHGVGRYRGLKTIQNGDHIGEYLILEYAQKSILYIPVTSLNMIHRYTGADKDHAPMHRLGSGQWDKAQRKAKEKANDIAVELLEIYAKRSSANRQGITALDEQYQMFANSFEFEPTTDQQSAINDVIDNMQSNTPMDRLICGDVGFGKTEVAMRAAFLAAQNNKQIAVLVPTTLLATQHYKSFLDRFADWPIKIAVLSRFNSSQKTKEILANIQNGTADIIIGTHKLLSKDIKFKNLGLLIIDEEHRFGVKQKELFKSLRSEIDILTLTATPIPRTLNLSISGMRDLSIISTPPNNRITIKTFIQEWDNEKIKEACNREISRGGQVYFLHNRVEDIDKISEELRTLLPTAEIGVAHGQLDKYDLEDVMNDFYHRRINILVCTTIIETGLDIPNANTIIINRADKLGLAQLYQIRGRVGRSHHRAYAYLIVPEQSSLSDNAKKRLLAIESITELGAGFNLAVQDMEIRGTGEILGDGQSGQISEVGFTMYSEILEQAVHDLKSGSDSETDKPKQKNTLEVILNQPALIPEHFVPDINQRLVIYKRIDQAENSSTLDDLQIELIDRFGLMPDFLKNLFDAANIKLILKEFNFEKVIIGDEDITIVFGKNPNIDPVKLIMLIQSSATKYELNGQHSLIINGDFSKNAMKLMAVNQIRKSLID